MLYNDGDKFDKVYYDGKRVDTIYKNGKNVYPGNFDVNGFIGSLSYPQGSTATSIKRSAELPVGISYNVLPRRYNIESNSYTRIHELVANITFYNCNCTYNIGDIVFHNGRAYTCLQTIDTPEVFNPNNWIGGMYPKLLGYYSSTSTYSVGDVVYSKSNTSGLRTCIVDINIPESYNSSHWQLGYYPKFREFKPYNHYYPGDVVYYGATYYTCKVEYVSSETFNSTNWIFQCYYPELDGIFDYNATYSLGDIVWYNNKVYTCKYHGTISRIYPTNTNYWINNYAPYIELSSGPWDGVKQYYIGDIFTDGSIVYMVTWPNIPYNSEDYAIYAWNDNGTIYIYCKAAEIITYADFSFGGYDGYANITNISALSTFNTYHTTNLWNCFYNCKSLTDITPISNWDVSNVYTFENCFYNCISLPSLTQLSKWDTRSAANFYYMFYNCRSLTSLDGLQYWDVSNVSDMAAIFYNCTSLADLSALSTWHTKGLLTLEYSTYGAFTNCSSLTNLTGLENWDVSKVTTLSNSFANCTSLSDISALQYWDVSNITSLGGDSVYYGLFRNCVALKSITPIAHWDTSKVTTIAYMFDGCTSLEGLLTLYWDMSSCTNYTHGFYNCSSITTLDLRFTNVSASFSNCFRQCSSLVVADFSRCTATNPNGYGTSAELFYECPNVERCDLGVLFTSSSMGIWGNNQKPFGSCTKLSVVVIRNTNVVFSRAYYSGSYGDGLSNLARNNGKVYVPQSLLDQYQANAGWVNLINMGVEILALEGSPYEEPGSILNN